MDEMTDIMIEMLAEYERDQDCDPVHVSRQMQRLWVTLRARMGADAFDAAIRERITNPTPQRLALKAERDTVLKDPADVWRRLSKGDVLRNGSPPAFGLYWWRFLDGTPVADEALDALDRDGLISMGQGMLDGTIALAR